MSLLPGSAAVVIATGVAALLFPSFVAGQHRRHGELRAGEAVLRFAALLYAIALACYVLPPAGTTCFAAQLRPLAGLSSAVGFGQFACNVVLFVPLGALLRRAPPVAVLAGAGLSVFIEVTQLTGLWFRFPCPVRVFDVDDVLANTLGAALGGLLVPLLPRPSPVTGPAEAPRPVTAGRRLLGMSCDGLLLWWLGAVCATATGAVLRWSGVVATPLLQVGATWLAPALILLVASLRADGTPGQRLVLLRVRAPNRRSVVLRWALGTGGLALLQAGCELVRGAPGAALGVLWCAAHALGALRNQRGITDPRGITGRLAGLELTDVRGPATARTP
ncbi:VanZ family protein [Saccharopolyspora sp. TS4A08]|uniref:VanZ family protein n=1 Tax=Saccharopolyspora ipomoeae TaxID=3042027 RepID=A0ABT6PKG7_9PSEU|nr:VanZ family protein [Saccharopolyspora sp. TS4A08]MDI2028469.1 VanZ family protein [Saccharopolyspora sp. TS4A08]